MHAEITPDRKAAILLASLEPAAAEALLAELPPAQAERLRAAASALGPLDPRLEQEVLAEFSQRGAGGHGQRSPAPAGHREGAAPSAALRFGGAAARDASGGPHPADETRPVRELPFDFLLAADEHELVPLLRGERPQVIALVLANLPPARAGVVLGQFPSELQVEIVRRIAELDAAHPEVVRDVAQALASRWSLALSRRQRRPDGLELVSRILEAVDAPTGEALLANLARRDRRLARFLRPEPPSFDDLALLDDAALGELFRFADPQVAALALAGADPAWIERVARVASGPLAKALAVSPAELGPLALDDVERAQRELAELAARLAAAGRFRLVRRERPHSTTALVA